MAFQATEDSSRHKEQTRQKCQVRQRRKSTARSKQMSGQAMACSCRGYRFLFG